MGATSRARNHPRLKNEPYTKQSRMRQRTIVEDFERSRREPTKTPSSRSRWSATVSDRTVGPITSLSGFSFSGRPLDAGGPSQPPPLSRARRRPSGPLVFLAERDPREGPLPCRASFQALCRLQRGGFSVPWRDARRLCQAPTSFISAEMRPGSKGAGPPDLAAPLTKVCLLGFSRPPPSSSTARPPQTFLRSRR